MPAPEAAPLETRVGRNFQAFGITLPSVHKSTHVRVCGHDPRTGLPIFGPEPTCPPSSSPQCLFVPGSMYACDWQVANDLSATYWGHIESLCEALCQAWSTWQSQATLTDVLVSYEIADGGRVTGPSMYTLIAGLKIKRPGTPSPEQLDLSQLLNALSQSFGSAWERYVLFMSVPKLAWYPTFSESASSASFPKAPSAVPNTVCPVSALTGSTLGPSASALGSSMAALAGGVQYGPQLAMAMGPAIAAVFSSWCSTTQVTNVIGTVAWIQLPSGPTTAQSPIGSSGGLKTGGGFTLAGNGTMAPGGFV